MIARSQISQQPFPARRSPAIISDVKDLAVAALWRTGVARHHIDFERLAETRPQQRDDALDQAP